MARFLSAIFVCVLLQIVRIRTHGSQVIDTNKGILVTESSEDMILDSSSSTIDPLETVSERSLEDITYEHPESSKGYELSQKAQSFTAASPSSSNYSDNNKATSTNSKKIDIASSTVSFTTTQDFLTPPYPTEDNDTATLDYYISSQRLNFPHTLNPLMELNNISSQSIPQYPQEPISTLFEDLPTPEVSLDQESEGTTAPQREYYKRKGNAIYKSTKERTESPSYSLEESFSLNSSPSYSLEPFSLNESYLVNNKSLPNDGSSKYSNISTYKHYQKSNLPSMSIYPSEDSSKYSNISTYKPYQKSNLPSMNIYPSENTKNNKSMHPYSLMTLEANASDGSLSSPVMNYSSSNIISPSLKKRSVEIQNENATIAQLNTNMNTVQADHSLEYSKPSSDFFPSITESNYQFVNEVESVTLPDLPETTESLSVYRMKTFEANKQNESSKLLRESDNSNQVRKRHITPLTVDLKEPFTFANETILYQSPKPMRQFGNTIIDYSPSPANVDNDINNISQKINTERDTENITTLWTETPSLYSTLPYKGTTLKNSNSSYPSYNFSESVNEPSSSHNLGSSENTLWLESPRTSQAREENSMPTIEMIDPVITKKEELESPEQTHIINTSNSLIYHSENPGNHLIDIMINKTAERRPHYHTSLLNGPSYVYSKDGLDMSTVIKSNNQTEKMHLINKNITYYNSLPMHTSNDSHINISQDPTEAEVVSTEQDLNKSSEKVNIATVSNKTKVLSDDISETSTLQTLTDSSDEPLSSFFPTNDEAGMSTYTTKESYKTLSDGYYKSIAKSRPQYTERDKMSSYEEFRLSRERKYQSEKNYSVSEIINLNKGSIFLHPLGYPEETLFKEPLVSQEITTNDQSNSTSVVEETTARYSTPYQTEATHVYPSENLTTITRNDSHSDIKYYMSKNTTSTNTTLVNSYAQKSSKNIFKVDPSSPKDVSLNRGRIIEKLKTMDNLERLENHNLLSSKQDDTERNLEIFKYSERKGYDIQLFKKSISDMGTFTTETTTEILPELYTDMSLEKSYTTEWPKTAKPQITDTLSKQELTSNDLKPFKQDVKTLEDIPKTLEDIKKTLEDIQKNPDNSKNININYILPSYATPNSRNPYLEHMYNNIKTFHTPPISNQYKHNFSRQIKCSPVRLIRQNGYLYPLVQRKCYYPHLYSQSGYTLHPQYQPPSMYRF